MPPLPVSVKLCCPPGQKPAQHLPIWSQLRQAPLPRDTCSVLHPGALGASVHDQPVWSWQHDLRFSASTLLLIALDLGRMDGGGGSVIPSSPSRGSGCQEMTPFTQLTSAEHRAWPTLEEG